VPVEHTRRARAILGPTKLLAPEQLVLLERDASAARVAGRTALSWYLKQPNYANSLHWLGFGAEELDPQASDRLVDALVAWGDEETIAGRTRDHLDAGADHVCVQPIGRDGDELGLEQLRRLAPVLLEL
jgi:probable F420-dependent oxidoreductase